MQIEGLGVGAAVVSAACGFADRMWDVNKSNGLDDRGGGRATKPVYVRSTQQRVRE